MQVFIAEKPTAVLNNNQRIRLFGDVATCSGSWVFDVNAADGGREKKPVRYLFVFENTSVNGSSLSSTYRRFLKNPKHNQTQA